MKILVADPNDAVRSFLSRALRLDGHDVIAAALSTTAWSMCQRQMPALVLTELRFRDEDGLTFIGRVKRMAPAPHVVTITLDNSLGAEIDAYAAGVTVHMVKPIVYDRIAAVVVAVGSLVRADSVVRCGTLMVDDLNHKVWIDEREVPLNDREFAIVSLLCRHQDAVVTVESIVSAVWGSSRLGDPAELGRSITNITRVMRRITDKQFIFMVPSLGGYTMTATRPLWADRATEPKGGRRGKKGN